MKATFKLTPAQIDAALEAQDIVFQQMQDDDDGRLLNCGLYIVEEHQATNPNQRVYLERGGYLVVEGERCALVGDDGYEVAMCIVGEDAVPVKYETSDPRLKWNETLAMYMKARAPLDARIAYVLDKRHHEWRWFIPELEPVVKALKTSAARANAQFDAYMISVGSKLIKETT
jgi:hypothetical protein